MATSGSGQWNPGQGLRGGGGLADHFDLVIGIQQATDALAHQLMVVEQEHTDSHGVPLCQGLALPLNTIRMCPMRVLMASSVDRRFSVAEATRMPSGCSGR